MMKHRGLALVIGLVAALISAVLGQGYAQQTASPATAEVKEAEANAVDPTVVGELIGKWRNHLGSTLEIKSIDRATGAITGSYRTKAGAGTPGQRFPLSGWVNTAPKENDPQHHVIVVAFSVRWGRIGSVTTWNGYYDLVDKSPAIVGQWLLSRPNSQFEWDHILAGQDTFKKLRADGSE